MTTVDVGQAAPPSAVTELGATEAVTADPPAAQPEALRAVRSAAAPIAACLRGSVDRDPSLAGDVAFTFQVTGGRPVGLVTQSGTLASLPSAGCVANVLGSLPLAADHHDVRVRYSITLAGTHHPAPLPGSLPNVQETAQAVDLSAARDVASVTAAPSDAVKRCFFGAEPHLVEPLWLVVSVGPDGEPFFDKPSGATEAELCVRRKLATQRFDRSGGRLGLSLSFFVAPDPKPKGPAAAAEQEAGMVGLLGTATMGDTMGFGGLGTTGIGEGGGGRGEGFSLGTLGHGAGTGTGQGFGSGHGRLGGSGRFKPPAVRMGNTSVSGKLPPEVVQRIVRQNFGRFRLCYENGLRQNPKLEGRVKVTFIIGRDGDVRAPASTEGSDLPDNNVRACVAKAFGNLSFPEPEGGGVVKVVYPIHFSPGDGAGAAAAPTTPPPPPKVDGKLLAEVDVATLERVLQRRRFLTRTVPVPPGEKQPLAVFFRDDDGTVGIARVTSEPPKKGCSATHGGRSLVVQGGGCDRTLRGLLDGS